MTVAPGVRTARRGFRGWRRGEVGDLGVLIDLTLLAVIPLARSSSFDIRCKHTASSLSLRTRSNKLLYSCSSPLKFLTRSNASSCFAGISSRLLRFE